MRLLIGLFAVVLLGLPIGGTASAAPQGKRVVVLATSNTNPYIGAWTSTFTRFATQAGMKVTNLSANYDAAVQSQQIDDAIAQKFDLIVICYVNDQAIVPALTRAKAAGIPVVLYATPMKKDQEPLWTSYIGTENSDLGRLAGEELVKGLAAEGKTKAKVIAVTGLAQQTNVMARMAAFKAVLAQHPGIDLVDTQDGKWNTAVSEKVTGELLVRFAGQGGIDGIFAMADNQATGAINAVEFGGPHAGRRQQGHRRCRQQLHEGRHRPHQVRRAIRHGNANSDRRGRVRREGNHGLFQRRAAEEIRHHSGLRHYQRQRRQVRRRLLVLSLYQA